MFLFLLLYDEGEGFFSKTICPRLLVCSFASFTQDWEMGTLLALKNFTLAQIR